MAHCRSCPARSLARHIVSTTVPLKSAAEAAATNVSHRTADFMAFILCPQSRTGGRVAPVYRMAIPMRPFGRHNDVRISALGFGGHHIGDAEDDKAAARL